jgi:hypothetical protein
LLPALATACDSEPIELAGSYTIALTNRANGCEFPNWTVGETASNIAFTVTQQGDNITAMVDGVAGLFLDLWIGGRVFQGTVDGHEMDLAIFGTRSQMMGAECTYTINSLIDARVAGDIVTGSITYVAATNGSPTCGQLADCESIQDFNGTRPPR